MTEEIFTRADFDSFREEALKKLEDQQRRERELKRETRRAFWRGLKNGFLTGLGFRR